jgi:hypothetical protein
MTIEEMIAMLEAIPNEAIYTSDKDGNLYVDMTYTDEDFSIFDVEQAVIDFLVKDGITNFPNALDLREAGYGVSIIHDSDWEVAIQLTLPNGAILIAIV